MSGSAVQAWLHLSHHDLAARCAAFEAENALLHVARGANEIFGMRHAISSLYCRGTGIEVGAGDRPFPIPSGSKALYGDSRDHEQLKQYFGTHVSCADSYINAETFAGVSDASADFVISAHVIEHLFNPLGSIRAMARVLRPGGHAIIAAPEMTQTFDRNRPVTTLDHVVRDLDDGGESTRYQAYLEHVRYVHPMMSAPYPEMQVEAEAAALMARGMDLHVHAWTKSAFEEMMSAACTMFPFKFAASVSLWNENIVVLTRR